MGGKVNISASPEDMARFFAAMSQFAGGAHSATPSSVAPIDFAQAASIAAAPEPPQLPFDSDPLALPASAIAPALPQSATPAYDLPSTPPPPPPYNNAYSKPDQQPQPPRPPEWDGSQSETVKTRLRSPADRLQEVLDGSTIDLDAPPGGKLVAPVRPSHHQQLYWQLQRLWHKSQFRAFVIAIGFILFSGSCTLLWLKWMTSTPPLEVAPSTSPSVTVTPSPKPSPKNPPPPAIPPTAPGNPP